MKKLLFSMLCMGAVMGVYAGTGTEADPYTCAEVIAMGADLNVTSATVKGYIVGGCNGTNLSSAQFNANPGTYSNVLIADSKAETDYNKCVPVQLVAQTDLRAAVNLGDNPGNYLKELTITGQLIKYFGVPGIKAPTAYKLDGNGGGNTGTTKYTLATSITSGKKYAIVSGANVAKPQATSNTFGYLYVDNVTIAGNAFTGKADYGFVITAVDGGYTIQDNSNRYLYQSGEHNSFNFSASRTDGDVWTIAANGDGTYKITNVAMNKYIQYSTQYTSFGSYADATGDMPQLYLSDEAVTPPTPVETTDVASIKEFLTKQLSNPCKFTFPITVAYQNGSYLYVTDGETPLLIYGQTGKTYQNGDVIPAGVTGTFQNYSEGQLQMSSIDASTFGNATAGTAVTPDQYQLEEISADLLSTYIEVTGVTLTPVAGDERSYTISDGTLEMTLYNQFMVTLSAGQYDKFQGFVAIHAGKLQLLPIINMGEIVPPVPPVVEGAYFLAPTADLGYPGAKLLNKDGSDTGVNTDENKSLIGEKFTDKDITLVFSHGTGDYFSMAAGQHVRWFQGDIVTLTPANGATIKEIFVQTVAYSKGAFTATEGTVTGEGTSADTPITWVGSANQPLVLTADKQIRFSYMQVKYDGGNDGVEGINADNNAPVEYYNLQGVRVDNPANGLYIRRQGNNVTKVIVM